MKKALLALVFIPVLLFGQTERMLVNMSDGSVQEIFDQVFPIDTIVYIANDSLSKEMNEKIVFGRGKDVLVTEKENYFYDGFWRILEVIKTTGNYINRINIVSQTKDIDIVFAWELFFCGCYTFLIFSWIQRIVVYQQKFDGVIFFMKICLASSLGFGLAYFLNDAFPYLYALAILPIVVSIVFLCYGTIKNPKRYRLLLVLFLCIFQGVFYLLNKEEEFLYATLFGLIPGILSVYFWKRIAFPGV